MAGIFISYRRADSDGWAGRLRDALRNRFGDLVFQDVDDIPDGEIFSDVIDRELQECDVALIIIGPNWASAVDEKGRRRLDQEDDWVRTETAMVLNRKIRVIPVLVGGARLPRADELPEDLRSLTKRQAREIRSTSWDSDVGQLMSHLKQIVTPARKRNIWLAGSAATIAVLGIGLFAAGRYFGEEKPDLPILQSSPPALPSAPLKRDEPAPEKPKLAESSRSTAIELPKEKPAAAPEPAKSAPVAESPPAPAKAKIAEAAPAKPKQREPVQLLREGPTELLSPAPPAKAPAERQASKPAPAARAPVARPSAPETDAPKLARREPAAPAAPAASQETRRPAPMEAEPSERAATPAPPVSRPPAAASTRTAALNLPNRPAAARELRVGDSWTYKLREVRYNKELATVTHEIGGGDTAGIRETVRIRRSGADADADSGSGFTRTPTQRRLPLEPRIFEQQLDQQATLLEFAPFMTAFSELEPGLRWSKIATASSSEWRFSGKVAGRETVRVPAGTFQAIKAELEGQQDLTFPSTRDPFSEQTPSYQTYSVWFVPEIGRAVKYERRTYNRGRRLLEHEQYELLSYQLK